MADAATTIYALVKPEVGASADSWGGKVNQDFDDVDALLGALTTAGSSNTYTLTTGLSLAAYVSGQSFLIKPNHANTGAATINVDGLGAKDLTKNGTTALASGDLSTSQYYRIVYDGTRFCIMGVLSGVYQPLDATLAALAALSWASGNALVQFTAADTVSLTLAPSVTTVTASGAITGGTFVPTSSTPPTNGLYIPASNTLGWAVNSTGELQLTSAALSPITTGGLALGTTSLMFDGAFFSSASSLNWNNGDVLLTHSSNALEVTGGGFAAPLLESSETTGTLTAASRNRIVRCSGGVTLDDGVFAEEDWLVFDAGASNRTFTRAAGLTMYVNGVDSATATLPANTSGGAIWRSSTVVVLSGAFY